MPPKRPSLPTPVAKLPARKVRVVEISPNRGTGSSTLSRTPSIQPRASQIADFSQTLTEVADVDSMLLVVGATPEAATNKWKRVLDNQAEAELRQWNQAHFVFREVATRVFRAMGVHMTLVYVREQHADARRSLLRFLEHRQDDLGSMFGRITGSSLFRALTELSKVGNEANAVIHSVSIDQVLDAISVFRKYQTQPSTTPITTTLALPSPECLTVIESILQHILGATTEEELRQTHNKDLGEILDTYTALPTVKDLELLQSIRLDWVPTWNAKHWDKVVAVAESEGLAVSQQKHRTQIKELESESQRAKDTAEASDKEMHAAKATNRTLQSEVKTLKARVKRLEVDRDKLQTENAAIKAENAAIKAENAAIKAENAAIKAENAAIKAENVRLNKRIEDMENRQEAMEVSHKTTITLFMAHIAIMEQQIANLTNGVTANTGQLQGL
ncbi:hypothetical protein L211DRAFT_868498 [Terfezia boudieri ATCC MYA-4762]|uniref:Uncharacterized protein n=1 Tax=Terfezia boudieri ATCC MYA-4762 TaxID=1051890 RepID=A0A3N4LZY1_9PEZI|nr:hypothetical protein L211DRAFT_868498 [Terfezia boudieri ATCC MYA-4762]